MKKHNEEEPVIEEIKHTKKKKKKVWVWILEIFIIALILSFTFSILSELIFSVVGIIVSVVVIFVLLFIGVVCDMIGVAVTSSKIEPFTAMRARKVRGSKQAMWLVKNAEKISSICNDVIGDICGILTGAAGAVIAVKLIQDSMGDIIKILIASSISAAIAGFTILGKASLKKVAMDNSTKIVLVVGKCLSIFSRENKKKKHKEHKKEEKIEEVKE